MSKSEKEKQDLIKKVDEKLNTESKGVFLQTAAMSSLQNLLIKKGILTEKEIDDEYFSHIEKYIDEI